MQAKIAILGSTGAVGLEFLDILWKRGLDPSNLRLLASARSAGKKLPYGDTELTVEEISRAGFEGIDIALFSAGGVKIPSLSAASILSRQAWRS